MADHGMDLSGLISAVLNAAGVADKAIEDTKSHAEQAIDDIADQIEAKAKTTGKKVGKILGDNITSEASKQKNEILDAVIDVKDAKKRIKELQASMTKAAKNIKKLQGKDSLNSSDYRTRASYETSLRVSQQEIEKITDALKAQGVVVRNTNKEYKELQNVLEEIGFITRKAKKQQADVGKATEDLGKAAEQASSAATQGAQAAVKATEQQGNAIDDVTKKTKEQTRATQELAKAENTVNAIVSRISKNASIKGISNLEQEATRVGKALATMYDEGIRDTEEYITLQYRLSKIFDELASQAGGVQRAGAKSATELRQWIFNSIKNETGFDIGKSSVIDAMFSDDTYSLFETSSKKKSLRSLADQLLFDDKFEPKSNRFNIEGAIQQQEQLAAASEKTANARKEEADATRKAAEEKRKYYEIDEKAAKISKQNRSFDDYKDGSATASYKAAVDEIAKIVEEKKAQFPDKSEKLDQLLDRYAKNLATYINKDNQIGAQYPSVMISGAGNYNIKKHNRQMASWGKNYQYYEDKVAAIENQIKNFGSTGTLVVRGDEEDALEKLEAKLEYMKYWHDVMVEVNKYYRKNKTLEGFEGVEPDELERIKKDLATIKQVGMYDVPYPQYAISNDNQNIKRIEGRITELKRLKDNEGLKEENDIYKLWTDKQDMRIRISFEMGKPEQEIIDMLKGKSFKWSPKNNAWQRQLTSNAVYDTKRLQESLHGYYKIDTSNVGAVQQQAQLTAAIQETADAREEDAKITVRTIEQVNAEFEQEKQKLQEINSEIERNDNAFQALYAKKKNYGKVVFGTDAAVYDTEILSLATKELKEFNDLLATRNKFQEKYVKLRDIISRYYIGERMEDYTIDRGIYKNMDQYISQNPNMRLLDKFFQQGQKTTNKEINELFRNVVRELQSDGATVGRLLSSGEVYGAQIWKELDAEETQLNQTNQRLLAEREVQLSKINALRQEELDLIEQKGQEERKNQDSVKQIEDAYEIAREKEGAIDQQEQLTAATEAGIQASQASAEAHREEARAAEDDAKTQRELAEARRKAAEAAVQKPELLEEVEALDTREEIYDAKTIAQKREVAEEYLRAEYDLYKRYLKSYESPDYIPDDGWDIDATFEDVLRQQTRIGAFVALYEKYGGKVEKLGKKFTAFAQENDFVGSYQYLADGYEEALRIEEEAIAKREEEAQANKKLTITYDELVKKVQEYGQFKRQLIKIMDDGGDISQYGSQLRSYENDIMQYFPKERFEALPEYTTDGLLMQLQSFPASIDADALIKNMCHVLQIEVPKAMEQLTNYVRELTSKYGKENFKNTFASVLTSRGFIDSSNALEIYDELKQKEQEFTAFVKQENQKREAHRREQVAYIQQSQELSNQYSDNQEFVEAWAKIVSDISQGLLTATEGMGQLQDVVEKITRGQQAQAQAASEAVDQTERQADAEHRLGQEATRTNDLLEKRYTPENLSEKQIQAINGKSTDIDNILKYYNIDKDDRAKLQATYRDVVSILSDVENGFYSQEEAQQLEALAADKLDAIVKQISLYGSVKENKDRVYEDFYNDVLVPLANNGGLKYDNADKAEFGDDWQNVIREFGSGFQKILNKKSNMRIDQMWEELTKQYPNLFSEDVINEKDQLKEFIAVARQARAEHKNKSNTISRPLLKDEREGLYDELQAKTSEVLNNIDEIGRAEARAVQQERAFAEEAKRVADEKKKQAEIPIEPTEESEEIIRIIEPDAVEALKRIRSTLGDKKNQIDLSAVFSEEDLTYQISEMVKNANQAIWKLDSVNIFGDTAQIKLYNEELGLHRVELYKLKKATEDAEKANLKFIETSRLTLSAKEQERYIKAQEKAMNNSTKWLQAQEKALNGLERTYQTSSKPLKGDSQLLRPNDTTMSQGSTATLDSLVTHIRGKLSSAADTVVNEAFKNEIQKNLNALDNEIKTMQNKQYATGKMSASLVSEARKRYEYDIEALKNKAKKQNVFGVMEQDLNNLSATLNNTTDNFEKFISEYRTASSKLNAEAAKQNLAKQEANNFKQLISLLERSAKAKKKYAEFEINGTQNTTEGQAAKRKVDMLSQQIEATKKLITNQNYLNTATQQEVKLNQEVTQYRQEQANAKQKTLSDTQAKQDEQNYNKLIRLQDQLYNARKKYEELKIKGEENTSEGQAAKRKVVDLAKQVADTKSLIQNQNLLNEVTNRTVQLNKELSQYKQEQTAAKAQAQADAQAKADEQNYNKLIRLQEQLYNARKKYAELKINGNENTAAGQEAKRNADELGRQVAETKNLIQNQQYLNDAKKQQVQLDKQLNIFKQEKTQANAEAKQNEELNKLLEQREKLLTRIMALENTKKTQTSQGVISAIQNQIDLLDKEFDIVNKQIEAYGQLGKQKIVAQDAKLGFKINQTEDKDIVNIAKYIDEINRQVSAWKTNGIFDNLFSDSLKSDITDFQNNLSKLGLNEILQQWTALSDRAKNAGANIKELYNNLLMTTKGINELNSRIETLTFKDGGIGVYAKSIQSLETQKQALLQQYSVLESEIQKIINVQPGTNSLEQFLKDAGVQAVLTTEEIQKLNDALNKSIGNSLDFVAKVASQVEPALNKLQDFARAIQQGVIAPNSKIANNVAGLDGMLNTKFNNFKQNPSAANALDVTAYISSISSYIDALDKAIQKEKEYFANKTKYESSTTTMQSMAADAQAALQQTGNAEAELTRKAEEFARASNASGIVVTKFVQDASGIARLDFSTIEDGTNAVRKFSLEMSALNNNNLYMTENTVKNTMASIRDEATKTLESMSKLITELEAPSSGINMGQESIQKLINLRNQLFDSMKTGSTASDSEIAKLAKDSKLAEAEVKKLLKQYLQMQEAIDSGKADDWGKLATDGSAADVYAKLSEKVKDFAKSQDDATLKMGKFNAKTNTLTYTLYSADGTVTTYTAHMDGLSNVCANQVVSVKELGSKWDQFKASVGNIGKQFMTAMIGVNVFYKALSQIRQGYGYVKEIDLALTELKKVTDETEASYSRFLKTASQTAGKIGSTVSDFTEATANFARLNI